MPSWKKVVVSGSDATLKTLFVSNTVTASVFSGSYIGPLTGTASWATNALTASYINTLKQSVIISGSTLSIIPTTLAGTLTENVLIIGPASSSQEGGQILLQAPGGTYTSASMWDNYQNLTRLLRGTNASSDAVVASWNMHTKQMQLPAYNSLGAFSGTPVAALAINSNGDVITIQTGSQSGGSGTTINSNTDNYILTATGTSNTIQGEVNLQFNGSTLSVTGNVTATSFTGSLFGTSSWSTNAVSADNFTVRGDLIVSGTTTIGDVNTDSITLNAATMSLGSGTGILNIDSNTFVVDGANNRVGILKSNPSTALDILGNVLITGSLNITSGITGSLQGTSSWATTTLTASYIDAANITTGTLNNSRLPAQISVTGVTASAATGFIGTASWASNAVNANNGTTVTTIAVPSSALTRYFLVSPNAGAVNESPTKHVNGLKITNLAANSATLELTGSITVTAGITGNLTGTSSWSSNAITASYINLVAGPNITIAYKTNSIEISGSAGGSGTPGGSNTQIQYNNSSVFGGVPTLTYDGTTLKGTGSFTGSFTGIFNGSVTSALTASYTPNALITASVSSNTLTFTKGNGTTFNLTVNTGSGGGGGSTSPGGSPTTIQYNSASVFKGTTDLTFQYDATQPSVSRLFLGSNQDFRSTAFDTNYPASFQISNANNSTKQSVGLSNFSYPINANSNGLIYRLYTNSTNNGGNNLQMIGFKCDYSLLLYDGSNYVASRIGTLIAAWSNDSLITPILTDTYVDGDQVYNELGTVVFTLTHNAPVIELYMDCSYVNSGTTYFNGLFTNFGNTNN